MADEPQQIRGIDWRATFPFTHIFRAFRVARHPSKLMLGLIALLALYTGGRFLDAIWSARSLAVPGEVYRYERLMADGGNSRQFAREREAEREKVEDADAAHRDALATAGTLNDSKEKDRAIRAADDAYNAALRDAYRDAYASYTSAKSIEGEGLFKTFFEYEFFCVDTVVKGVIRGNWLGKYGDDRGLGVVPGIINFFTVGPVWLMRHHPVYFVIFTLLFLTVWAIFGGAICRIAAVHVARDEKLSVRAALAFSFGKFLSFVSAPLIPLVLVLLVGLVPLIAGLLASIPFLGPIFNILMGILFVLILAAGFVMTLVLL